LCEWFERQEPLLILVGIMGVLFAVTIGVRGGWIDEGRHVPLLILAGILAVLLASTEYWNYRHGQALDRVCELLGPHDAEIQPPRTARQEIDNICISRQPDD
jgi:hypothetical protein